MDAAIDFDAATARPAVFIDKDGTLVDDVPYNADPALQRIRPSAPRALAALAQQGYALVVVSNQSGIGRGLFSAAQFDALRQALQQELEAAGVRLDAFFHCPHAPGASGRPACACRKPRPGMLMRAARRHRLDLARSWMVGDTLDDVEAGHRAGCRSLLYDSGGETVWRLTPLRRPDARVDDWPAVARLILDGRA